MRHTGFRDIICIRKNQNPVNKENDADMKKVLAMVLAFCLLCGSTSAFAVTYTMPEKLSRQLVIGSGLKGSFVLNAEGSSGAAAVLPPAVGLLAGFAFLLLIDYITPHIHPVGGPEGPESRLSRTAKLALAVTIHNFPEGMAVGVAIAGALTADFNMAGALALSLGIAIQNVPEGAIISMPLRAEGNSRWRAFGIGALSGVVEPLGGALVLLLATSILGIMPYMLAFAAGAMLYVVVEELVPEYSQGEHSNIGTIGFALGFVLMMVLDVVLG